MPRFQKQKRETLAETLLNMLCPPNYDPPPNRVAPPLVGWSGLETDPKPEGWTDSGSWTPPPGPWHPSS